MRHFFHWNGERGGLSFSLKLSTIVNFPLSSGPFTEAIFVAATRCNFCHAQGCNFKIARVIQVRFLVLFLMQFFSAISQGFKHVWNLSWCNFGATKIASSCREKNRRCKRALILWPSFLCFSYKEKWFAPVISLLALNTNSVYLSCYQLDFLKQIYLQF